ncbi:MAG: transporter substrate-binding domain-containing protein [Rhizobiaceae bacterium]|nr:transporter substrate-binding domain-containing protein [Rhizobiaceae bacterium]
MDPAVIFSTQLNDLLRLVARQLLAALALILAGILPCAAQSSGVPALWDARERLPSPDLSQLTRLRFLTTTDFPPFNFLDPGGRLVGLHIDLARAICAELNVTDRCQIQALPWDELQSALENGDGEAILAGISVTAQARATYAFSRPYMIFPARFLVRRNSALAEPLSQALAGQRVGVVAGSTHERMLRAYFPKAKVITYSNAEWTYRDLRDGSLAAVFADGMQLSMYLGSIDHMDCCKFAGGAYISPEFLGQGLSIAVSPENRSLTDAMDYALHAISTKGKMTELYLRYFPVGFF